jgi:hypothetical protein
MKRRETVSIGDLPEGVSEIGESDLDLDLRLGGIRKQGTQKVSWYFTGSDGVSRAAEWWVD